MNPLISPARFKPAVRSGSGAIEFGITQLVNGQAYIDVVLTTTLTDTVWDTVCSVVNTDDSAPLNISPGLISAKSTTGFTVQLNGMPDSSNYFLHWTIIPGASAPAVVATTYIFSGPSSGTVAAASTPFSVHLLSGQTVPAPVTVTPHDGGAGGTFTPVTVNLTTAAPSATFTYTPASAGAKTISVTNNRGLTDPANLTYTATASLFDPSTIAGLKLWLKADTLALSDGASVAAWNDSSSNAYNLTGGAQFKTNIVNGKPVVRFDGIGATLSRLVDIAVPQPYTIFVLGNARTPGTESAFLITDTGLLVSVFTNGKFYLYAGTVDMDSAAGSNSAFHNFCGIFSSSNGTGYIDGVLRIPSAAVGSAAIGHVGLLASPPTSFFPGDIAEVLIYNSALSTTDRQNVEGYLRTKYATP